MDLLAAIRLSRHRGEADPSTSPDRQEGTILEWAKEEAHKIIAWANDLDVSAITLSPFERPDLGNWLANRTSEFEGIVWAKLDRAVRKMDDLHKLALWAAEHKKVLFIASGPAKELRLDMRAGPMDPVSQIILTILAFAAQMEGDAIRERNKSTREYLRSIGRWPGGMYPYHTMPQKVGNGWKLALNPETAPTMEKIIHRVIKGASKLSIAKDFNAQGILSPREYRISVAGKICTAPVTGIVLADHQEAEYRKQKPRFIRIQPAEGSEPVIVPVFPRHGELDVAHGEMVTEGSRIVKPILWNSKTIAEMCRARVLIGQQELDGKPLLTPDGSTVERVERLIDLDTWRQLQRKLDESATPSGKTRTIGGSLILGVGHCAGCGSRLHRRTLTRDGKRYPYYGCRSKWAGFARQSKEERCIERAIPAGLLEETVNEVLIAEIGHLEVREAVLVPGESHASELGELEAALVDLIEMAAGKTGRVKEIYLRQMAGVEARIQELSHLPETVDRTELLGTGKTYEQLWATLSQKERHDLLVNSEIKVFLGFEESSPALDAALSSLPPGFRRSTTVAAKDHTITMIWSHEIADRLAQATLS